MYIRIELTVEVCGWLINQLLGRKDVLQDQGPCECLIQQYKESQDLIHCSPRA